MTKKPLNPLEDQPTASSSEDDEVETSSGEEEEGSSSEEDEPQPPSVAAIPGKPAVSATATKQESDSDSGETETDSDSEPDEPPKNPNTGSEKATTVTVAATNPKKKEPLSSSSATSAVKSGTKRPTEGTSKDEGNAKRVKMDASGEDTKKPPPFQRLWTEDDEIALLQGMIDFKKETGKSPYDDSNQFYESVKKSISFEVRKTQFMDKRWGLKNKYMRKGKNGKQVSFSKPHDIKCFALSNTIWGPDGMAHESTKSNGKSLSKIKKLKSVKQDSFSSVPNGKSVEEGDKKVLVHGGGELETSDWFYNTFLVRSIAGYGVDERTVKQGWRSAPVEAKKKIEEEMKALRAMEIEFLIRTTQFLNEAFSMIAEVIKQREDI